MSAPVVFLLVSLVGAAFTLMAVRRLGSPNALSFPYFFAAWLTGELALWHVAWQLLATLGFVAAGALAAWPGWLALAVCLASWSGLVRFHRRAQRAPAALESALVGALGREYRQVIPAPIARGISDRPPRSALTRPFALRDPRVKRIADIAYGDAADGRNLLDVYGPQQGASAAPVLLQVHGGGWVYGDKEHQGKPLMNHLASQGWVCVAINYRLSPAHAFPAHLVDVKRALAWIRENIAEHGGDPDFVAITGGSAGGHLCSLVALSAGDAFLQPGFEQADTSVAACVPFYGIYDFLDRGRNRGRYSAGFRDFIAERVLQCAPESDPALWRRACPIDLVHDGAPPFFVIHGVHDTLAVIEEARDFVAALRAVSRQPVAFAELEQAQHAFDVFHSVRSAAAVAAVSRFLETVYAQRCPERAARRLVEAA